MKEISISVVFAGTVTLTESTRSSGEMVVRSRSRALFATAEEWTSWAWVSRLTVPVVRPPATSPSVLTGVTRTLAVEVYSGARITVKA